MILSDAIAANRFGASTQGQASRFMAAIAPFIQANATSKARTVMNIRMNDPTVQKVARTS